MAVTDEQIENAFNDFQKAHNHNIPVKLNIEERHPYDSTQEAIDNGTRVYASYQQSKQQVNVYRTAPFSGDEQALRAIRHELVGHYGIDTFAPIEKRVLLDTIIQSRNEPTLKEVWDRVELNYSKLDKYNQAEEVYAVVAEYPQELVTTKERTTNHDPEQLIVDLSYKATITGLELRTITESVDNGIIAGLRQTQNIREHDGAAFSKDMTLEPIETRQNNNQTQVLQDQQKTEIHNHAYEFLAKNMQALKSDTRFSDKSNVEIADIAYYRGVMEKVGEIKGLPVDYNKYDTKALLFGVPHVETIENHEAVKEPVETKSRNNDDGHSM